MPHGHPPGTTMTRFHNVVAHIEGEGPYEFGHLIGGGRTVNEAWHELCDRIRRDLHKHEITEITYDDWRAA